MSFGFDRPRRYKDLDEAIEHAHKNNVLLFAAASNEGGNVGTTFPARDKRVFCIHSTDGNGKPSGFNPAPAPDDYNFSILGEYVLGSYVKGGSIRFSGTSMATAIAAGVAALVLEFAQQRTANDKEDIKGSWKLNKISGMGPIFLRMTQGRVNANVVQSEYRYIKPWNLLFTKEDEEPARYRRRIADKIEEILEDVD